MGSSVRHVFTGPTMNATGTSHPWGTKGVLSEHKIATSTGSCDLHVHCTFEGEGPWQSRAHVPTLIIIVFLSREFTYVLTMTVLYGNVDG